MTSTVVAMASAAATIGGMPRVAAMMRTMPPARPTSAPTTGNTRAACLKSGTAAGLMPSSRAGTRVRKMDALFSSSTAVAISLWTWRSLIRSSPSSVMPCGQCAQGYRTSAPPGKGTPGLAPLKRAELPVVSPSSGLPFDDFRALVATMPGPDEAAVAAVRARDSVLTKPAGALGRLEEIVEWLAAWQGRAPPAVNRPLVAVFAGNHGVVAQGVSAFPGGGDARRWSTISPPAARPSTRSASPTTSA